jgi:hypothetical protein
MNTPAAQTAHACSRCAHWADDRALLETRIPGLASFGSAYGATLGASRLCLRHDRLVMPGDRCAGFEARYAKPAVAASNA